MNQIDDLMLQRLVDGELNHHQIQQILATAQTSPEQWKEIACGFVEQQIWNRSFTNANAEEPSFPNKISGQIDEPVIPDAPAIKPTVDHHDKFSNIRSRSFSWLLTAASLMLAATIGYSINRLQTPNIAGSDNNNNDLIIANTDPPGVTADGSAGNDLTQTSLKPDYHVELPANNEILADWAPANSVSRVPLYQVSNRQQLDRLRQKHRPTLPQEVIDRLSRSGYQLEQHVELISGRLDDGRAFYVPVQTIKLLPGQ